MTLAASLAVGTVAVETTPENVGAKKEKAKADNVIVLVMDGVSSTTTTLARWYKGGPLAMDEIVTGGVRTYSAESAITDSAPAGTAMATGYKSNDKFIGVLPATVSSPGVDPSLANDPYKPVANVLEGAQAQGKATGIISTSEIQHATPAAFSSHAENRSQYDNIAEQQVYQNMDVILGGGKRALMTPEDDGSRLDGENLLNVIEERGYDLVETRDELLNSSSDKLWGAFAPDELAYDLDREALRPEEPTLAEMTGKAISTLSQDKDGFFLFIEGSKPDWAAHGNDVMGMIGDVLAFDAAVEEALEFAKKDKKTMVVAVSDHGNSGISIGNQNTSTSYSSLPVSEVIDPLKDASMTVEGALSLLEEGHVNLEEAAALYGLKDLTAEEREAIDASEDLEKTFVELLAERANIGFTTGGHTGEDVFLHSYGPGKPVGMIENTDIANAIAAALGFDLGKLDKDLFINAEEAFKGEAFDVRTDITDENNPVLVVSQGKTTAEFPVNKNIVVINGKEIQLNSVTVQTNGQFYISKEAVKAVKKGK
ncbi:alkaline phosphatase [Jeotgalibacillus proteolyticus]|uniref:Alkaline phosphatase n=1 Tax=Jeotgalibacillus proteolyticus TaxID=2082395 RepID=A0A2S5GC37_9BACL|nr:alkaline phosphatase [Jeotgalibacillus proteolyticus]PPA70518.1 alkaline phosphatase [Jeotgalibacillus proteolyticus]